MTLETAAMGKQQAARFERSLIEICRSACLNGPSSRDTGRQEAVAWLERNGLGIVRAESWRNSSLAALANQEARFTNPQAAHTDMDASRNLRKLGNTSILWLIDGIPSTDAEPVPGIRWIPLRKVVAVDSDVGRYLGKQVRPENGLVAANLAGYADGWCLVVEPGVSIERPIELRVVDATDTAGRLSLPRLLVVAGAASKLQLIERQYSPSGETTISSLVTEVVLHANAKLEHLRHVEHGSNTWAIATTAVDVGEQAQYQSWSVTGRGRFVRHDLAVHLTGRAASTTLDGLYYARQGETVAQHTRVWHDQPDGRTLEAYRGVVENRGRGIFDGCITVARGAMRTDARQENRNLLLGPEAIADTKPQLEIDADDVSCSHGATVGQLDEQQLFYLRARGISEAEARQVLTWAFAQEIVARCPNNQLRNEVELSLRSVQTRTPVVVEVGP